MRLKSIYRSICILLLLLVVMVACTNPEPGANTSSSVRLSLSATAPNTGTYVGDDLDCERIKWYRVAFTTPSGRQIVLTADKTLQTAADIDPLDEIRLSPGTYHVYAFANIDTAYLNELGIKEGGRIPDDISALRYTISDHFNAAEDANGHQRGQLLPVDTFAAAGCYVPMTGLAPQVVEVSTRVNQTFHIEVRRLFAKLEFVFRNTTEHNLQVNSISVGDMTTNMQGGSVLLMNYEENRNYVNLPYNLPDATLTDSFASPSVVYASGASVNHSYYVLESRSNSITNAFDLSFGVTQMGESASGVEADDMRYALTDPATLTLIHRNDWITIPITFSEWQMRLEARCYPPIGGYPETQVEETESDEFVVTFSGGGDFVIRPFIRRYYDGSDWFGIDDKSKVSSTPVIVVEQGEDHLFTKEPFLSETGEILGTMGSFSGRTASVTIRINVVESASPLVTKTLTRKIFITQK